MPLFTINLDFSDRVHALCNRFVTVLEGGQSEQFERLETLLTTIEEKMVTIEDFQTFATDLNREVGQIKDFIANLETQLAQGADDAAFRAFVEGSLPGLKASVGELDKFTPEPAPPEPPVEPPTEG